MKPQRPYLLKALYDWIVDSGEVPYVLVDAGVAGVQVPQQHVRDGQIVLNLSPSAVRDLVIDEQGVMCGGRFGGQHFDLYLPMAAILAIYAKDKRQGMVFPDEEALARGDTAGSGSDEPPDADGGKPNLRLV